MIYLDNHSTTPVDPRVVSAMLPYLTEQFGNPSSRTHAYGWEAEDAVEGARTLVADLIGSLPSEVVFTSGGTESNNIALKGVALANREKGSHIITTAIEHESVLRSCAALQRQGYLITYIPINSDGTVEPEEFRRAIRKETVLASVMLVNHEIGTINPVLQIGRLCEEFGIIFHVDAVQAIGLIPVRVDEIICDLLSLSAHKVYGPKGVGALFVRRRNKPVDLEPILHGGGQENGIRPGTLAVPQIVGFGRAARIAREEGPQEAIQVAGLRDHMLIRLQNEVSGIVVNGSLENRIAGNLNVSLPGFDGDSLIRSLAAQGVAVSSGAACSSGTMEPSHVLIALGVDPRASSATIRFGIGRFNTKQDVDTAVDSLKESINSGARTQA
ncbi:MAG TPA: cysteine desulfurase family protein [Thermoanaerobaculia bacterium]